jgi:hypothetical protein
MCSAMDWDEDSREVLYHYCNTHTYPTPLYNYYTNAVWFTIKQLSNMQSHNDIM